MLKMMKIQVLIGDVFILTVLFFSEKCVIDINY